MNENSRKTILSGRLNGTQRNKLRRLIDMMYTPNEIAKRLGIDVRYFYRYYIPMGCPHERDTRKHYWINGIAFREWYAEKYRKQRLAENQAYCMTCRTGVPMVNPVQRKKNGLTFNECDCPNCGRRIARIMDKRSYKNDR